MIVITAPTGQIGRHVVDDLIGAGTVELKLSQAQILIVEAGTRLAMNDQETARFGLMSVRPAPNGDVLVCGVVSAMNDRGAYTGEQVFIGTLSSASFSDVQIGGAAAEQACLDFGIVLKKALVRPGHARAGLE